MQMFADEALKRKERYAAFLKAYESRLQPLVERIAQFQEEIAAPKKNKRILSNWIWVQTPENDPLMTEMRINA